MYELRRILIIGMQHDDDISTELQRFPVAAFLVATIAFIGLMPDDVLNTKATALSYCIIAAIVIYKYHIVYYIKRNLFISTFKRQCRIISGQHNYYFLTVQHNELQK